MGIDIYEARFLLECRKRDVDFGATLMLGRQTLAMSARSLAYVMRKLDLPVRGSEIARVTLSPAPYRYPFAEAFFELLGANTVDSLDRSDYEGATIVADLAGDISPVLAGKFTAVVDCGTLEHVIDATRGLANSLALVAPGGHYIGIVPANNALGHGFYQFSPEFFYRLLNPVRGFEVVRMHVCERAGVPRFRDVPDPARAGHRIELSNSRSTYLMVLARRIGESPAGAEGIAQSDYVTAWEASGATAYPNYRDRLAYLLKEHLPPRAFEAMRSIANMRFQKTAWRELPPVPWR